MTMTNRDDYKRLADEYQVGLDRMRISGYDFGDAVRNHEIVIEALRAAEPVKAGEVVAVRQLEWAEPSAPNSNCHYDHVTAPSALGEYRVEWKGWKDDGGYVVSRNEDFESCEDTLDAAKAAAQADYEAHIRSALVVEPAPTPDTSGVAMRDALTDIASWKNDTLGTRDKNAPASESRRSFDRGVRMAFYRCAKRADAALAANQSDSGVRTAPASCPCFNHDDCSNVDTCNLLAEAYRPSDIICDSNGGKERFIDSAYQIAEEIRRENAPPPAEAVSVGLTTSPELSTLIQRAKSYVMTPEEMYEQRKSFMRGMCPSSRDYKEWCEQIDKLMPPLAKFKVVR